MASTLNDRFELIEPLPTPPGDIGRVAYKMRETVVSAVSEEAPAGRVVMLRLLPTKATGPSIAAASEAASKLKGHPNILTHYGLAQLAGDSEVEPGLYAVTEYARG